MIRKYVKAQIDRGISVVDGVLDRLQAMEKALDDRPGLEAEIAKLKAENAELRRKRRS